MEKILQDLQGDTVYIDNILVTGRSDADNPYALQKVLQGLNEYGLQLKREKCLFMKPSVVYLGYLVNKLTQHPPRLKPSQRHLHKKCAGTQIISWSHELLWKVHLPSLYVDSTTKSPAVSECAVEVVDRVPMGIR